MKISDILRYKGSNVVTIAPSADVRTLLSELAEHNVGALLVSLDSRVIGVVSERDLVRKLNSLQGDLLQAKVEDIMTTNVISCSSDDALDEVAQTMTDRRIRHMPVIDDGALVGIVTIGDVVLNRSRELEQQRRDLEQYITG
ncbi:CBS domain protein [Jatrophihabitans sp. GAS493]|uniref:CBS domain-containing protein n=1 Tax=Jatrophihabitans sp. GAS493 TaxID=1907575 RepID=UPI000BB7A55D|nr:CBS domain-containing protein [Jatrophihabitans sp. GAS493]SOD71491.1 CBS domain protein [Jatrophihabitans sp. GAS493]